MTGDFRLARGDVKRISFFHANGRFVVVFCLLTLPMKLYLLNSHQIVESHVLHAQFSFVRETSEIQPPKNSSLMMTFIFLQVYCIHVQQSVQCLCCRFDLV